jgi:hypothetical protein
MTSPALLQASESKRTEAEVRARRSATQDRQTEGENPPPVPASEPYECPRCGRNYDAAEDRDWGMPRVTAETCICNEDF